VQPRVPNTGREVSVDQGHVGAEGWPPVWRVAVTELVHGGKMKRETGGGWRGVMMEKIWKSSGITGKPVILVLCPAAMAALVGTSNRDEGQLQRLRPLLGFII